MSNNLKISDVVTAVQEKKWTQINNFSIDIDFVPGVNGNKGPKDFANMCGWEYISNKDLNVSLISVTTPQYQNALVQQYVAYEWRFHQGRDELYRFNMTFRDYDQMKLYNTFRMLYIKAKEQYYDKIKMNIKVNADDALGLKQIPVFQTSTAIIENVSQLQFSHNTENQIAEFTVSFICNTLDVSGTTVKYSGKVL